MRALFFAAIACVSLGSAQTYQPLCEEVLSFTAKTFNEIYVAVTNNYSEQGYNQAAVYWGNCKRQDNQRRLEGNPDLKNRLDQLRRLYLDLRRAETDLALQFYGGGTLYSHTLTRTVVPLEEHLSDLISLTTRRLGNSQAKGFSDSYTYNLSQIELSIKALRTRNDRQLGAAKRTAWNTAVANYDKAFRNILKLMGNRKDATSSAVLAYVNTPLWVREILR